MENFQRFITIGDDRINVAEIVSYGVAVDEDEDSYIYVNTSDGNDFSYYDDEDNDFDVEDKLAELDSLLLIRPLGHVNFQQR